MPSDNSSGDISSGTATGTDPSRQPDPAPPRAVPADPVPRSELNDLASRAPVSQDSVDRLNRRFAADPLLGLRVVRTLVDDPATWADLFALDDEHSSALSDVRERSRAVPMSRLLDKATAFTEDLAEVTMVVITPHDGIPLEEEESNPWFVPDKLEIKGSADTDGKATVSATVTWNF